MKRLILTIITYILIAQPFIKAKAPGGVNSNFRLWLKADKGVTTSGSDVTDWLDQSGNNRDFTQGDGSKQPVYQNSGNRLINFNESIDFDGNDDLLVDIDGEDYINGLDSITIISVIQSDQKGVDRAWFDTEDSDNKDDVIAQRYDDEGLEGGADNCFKTGIKTTSGEAVAESEANLQSTQPDIINFDWGATEILSWRVNGQSTSNSDDENTVDPGDTIDQCQKAIVGDGPKDNWDGLLGEIIIYGKKLTSTERDKVESYLAIKYGITLGNTSNPVSYQNSAGTTIWSGDATYQNDIAGIGRDDNSALSQTKSKSVNNDAIVTMALTESGGSFASPGNFDNDKEFMLWGNNNGTLEEQSSEVPSSGNINKRMGREWKIRETGNTGNVDIKMDIPNISVTESIRDFAILVDEDGDGDFTTGNIRMTKASSFTNDTVSFKDIDFNDGEVFTLGISRAVPGGISNGLTLWYKADAGISGGSPDISEWLDQSKNSFNAPQSDGSEQPDLVSNDINFNPSVTFDGSSEYFPIENLNYNSSGALPEIGVFVIFKSNFSGGSYSDNWAFLDYDRSEFFNFYIRGTGELGFSYADKNSIYDITGNTNNINNNQPQLVGALFDTSAANDTRLRLNGTDDYFNDEDAIAIGNDDNSEQPRYGFIGDGSEASSFDGSRNNINYDGKIAEIIYYEKGSFTNTELQQIETYLAIKYGITLGNTSNTVDYLASDGSTIWNGDASYQNDIAGIGRDDEEALVQKQSSSVNSDGIVTMGLDTIADDNKSNTNSFGSDISYMLWGNDNDDNGSIEEQSGETPSNTIKKRLDREWKIQETGSVGNVDINMDISGVSVTGTNKEDFTLLIDEDGDGDFTTGDIRMSKASSFSNDTLTFKDIDFADGEIFTVATSLATPGGINTNLLLWLRANNGVNTSSGNVTDWLDQSGNSRDFTQSSGGQQPVYQNSGSRLINFNESIDFDGSDDRLVDDDGENYIDGLDSITIISVIQSDQKNTNRAWFDTEDRDNKDDLLSLRYDSDGAQNGCTNCFKTGIEIKSGDSTKSESESGLQSTQPDIINFDWGAKDTMKWRVNGRKTVNTYTNYTVDGKIYAKKAVVGDGSMGPWDGLLGEVIIYDKKFSSSERKKVESYLAVKYGITLGSTSNTVDYLATDGTTIWSGDATYQNDIAGIGRDDDQGLAQKQSKSVNSDAIVTMGLDTIKADNKSNTNSFSSDISYMLWGNDNDDNGTIEEQSTEKPYWAWKRLDREWKIQETGSVGNVEVQFNISGISVSGTTKKQFKLMVDTDGDADFTTGTIKRYHASDFSSDTVTFENVDFSDGDIFGLVTEIVAPGGVSLNLTQWYMANGAVNTSGSSVTTWNSETGDADAATISGDPELIDDTINYNYGVVFDGNDHLYKSGVDAGKYITSSDNAMFGVYNLHADGVLAQWQTNPQISMKGSSGKLRFDHPSTSASDQAISSSTITDKPVIGSGMAHSGNDSLYVNGIFEAESNGGTIDPAKSGNFTIGANKDGTNPGTAEVGEVFFYKSSITNTERKKIESYLAIKYGITLGNSSNPVNYLDTDGNTIWTGDATFQNDIAGIGRDDRQGLNQKQSKSQNSDGIVSMGLGSIASSNSANSNTFSSDKSYLVWGSNGRAAESRRWPEDRDSGLTENGEYIEVRLKKQWKVQETGSIGTVRIKVDMSEVPGVDNILGNNDLQYLRLLIDEDGNFSDGAKSISPASYNNSTDIAKFDHDFTSSDGYEFSFGSVDESVTPLPVDFIKFTVNPENNKNILKWSTGREVNSDKFIIQRSLNLNNWNNIDSLNGAGNTEQKQNYEYKDHNLDHGLYYYRIKQVDFDSSSMYSSIKKGKISGHNNIKFHIHPNPTTGKIHIKRTGKGTIDQYWVKISNVTGQILKTHILETKAKGETIELSQPAGQYFLIIKYQDKKEIFKVIKKE